ncbi:hypothetical protein [Halosimplex salinum]|uniref:hypothetical protein n=1 Tax=Halosimplex salinum TaxID=1710538 RepID=UPI0019CFF05F|nr:hypothetical protein [Halosimplex salinum]
MSDATDGEAATLTAASGDESDDAYGGIVTAFPYAFRTSESRVFRSYVAVSGLCTSVVVLLFAFAVVVLLGGSASAPGGSFTFSRAFFVFLMLLVIAPLVAPVLLVARRHRRTGSDVRYDRALALSGYGFLAALYVMLVISVPAQQQSPPTGVFGPVVAVLYDLPAVAGLVPPLVVVGVMVLAHRRLREDAPAGTAAAG